MTNLQRWLLCVGAIAVPYIAIVAGTIPSLQLKNWMLEIQLLPIILLGIFCIFSGITVLYRTFTFNDCPEAAVELQRQILEARAGLIAKGFIFHDKSGQNLKMM